MDKRIVAKSMSDGKVLAKARTAGYKAALDGRPRTDDPYVGRYPHFSEQWLAGWDEAQQDLGQSAPDHGPGDRE